jgi:hypothetical protein
VTGTVGRDAYDPACVVADVISGEEMWPSLRLVRGPDRGVMLIPRYVESGVAASSRGGGRTDDSGLFGVCVFPRCARRGVNGNEDFAVGLKAELRVGVKGLAGMPLLCLSGFVDGVGMAGRVTGERRN